MSCEFGELTEFAELTELGGRPMERGDPCPHVLPRVWDYKVKREGGDIHPGGQGSPRSINTPN